MSPSQQKPGDETPRHAEPQDGCVFRRARPVPSGLEQRLLARARRAELGLGDNLIVGFSGGRDSLALALGLRRVRDVLGIDLLLVHVDHQLRAESGNEADQASDLAAALGLAFRGLVTEAMPHEIHPGLGIEEAARRERYRLLYESAVEAGAKAIVTGHHEQDQAETVLLHLLRGSGVHGAVGMSEWTRAPIAGGGTRSDISHEHLEPWLWRPFLQEPRAAIDAYVDQVGLDWVEDPSNSDSSLRRNVVRSRIMPLLESEFPGASAALARYATLAAADDEVLEQLAQLAIEGQVDPGGQLKAEVFRGQPLGMQRRMVRRWLGDCTGKRDLTAERTDAILGLCYVGRENGAIEVGGGWTVSMHQGMLRARRNQAGEREAT